MIVRVPAFHTLSWNGFVGSSQGSHDDVFLTRSSVQRKYALSSSSHDSMTHKRIHHCKGSSIVNDIRTHIRSLFRKDSSSGNHDEHVPHTPFFSLLPSLGNKNMTRMPDTSGRQFGARVVSLFFLFLVLFLVLFLFRFLFSFSFFVLRFCFSLVFLLVFLLCSTLVFLAFSGSFAFSFN